MQDVNVLSYSKIRAERAYLQNFSSRGRKNARRGSRDERGVARGRRGGVAREGRGIQRDINPRQEEGEALQHTDGVAELPINESGLMEARRESIVRINRSARGRGRGRGRVHSGEIIQRTHDEEIVSVIAPNDDAQEI